MPKVRCWGISCSERPDRQRWLHVSCQVPRGADSPPSRERLDMTREGQHCSEGTQLTKSSTCGPGRPAGDVSILLHRFICECCEGTRAAQMQRFAKRPFCRQWIVLLKFNDATVVPVNTHREKERGWKVGGLDSPVHKSNGVHWLQCYESIDCAQCGGVVVLHERQHGD